MKSRPLSLISPLVFAALTFVALGCAPSIGLNFPVTTLPEPELSATRTERGEPVRVRVGRFVDARATQTIVVIDGRKVDSQGAVAPIVEEGFERYLRHVGARLAVLQAPIIEGQIVDWSARVEPGFPTSEARAVARLKVTVSDSNGQGIYHATFSGEANQSHPILGIEEIQQVLGQAMGSAIEAAVVDQEFIAQLSKGRLR